MHSSIALNPIGPKCYRALPRVHDKCLSSNQGTRRGVVKTWWAKMLMACTILIASFTAALMHRMTKPEVLNKGVQHSLFVVFRKESPSFHRRWTFLSLPLALSFPRMEPHTEMTTITVTSSYHNILWQVLNIWSSIYKIIACNAIFAIFVSEFLVFLYFFSEQPLFCIRNCLYYL